MKNKLGNNVFLIVGLIILLISAGILLYPSISNIINQKYAKGTITEYSEQVNTLDDASKDELLSEADKYNQSLKEQGSEFQLFNESIVDGYDDILSFDSSIIGYIEIPAIDVYLPIYHGTENGALEKGVVHLQNTAFPIGGLGNHTIISGHTAYVGQIFFDNIHKLVPGDEVYIKILGDTHTYVVVEQNVVLPTDLSKCQPDRNRDLLSLVTCFPYAQNTHRLIVLCERKTVPSATAETVTANETTSESTVAEDDSISHTLRR